MEWDGRALRTSSGMGAADRGEYRQAAGAIEPAIGRGECDDLKIIAATQAAPHQPYLSVFWIQGDG